MVSPVDAPDDATVILWPDVKVQYDDNGTNRSVVVTAEARRTRLAPDLSGYAVLLDSGASVPATGWAFRQSLSYAFITNYTGVVVTNVVGGVTNTVPEYSVSTNGYPVLSLYRDRSLVWTIDPADPSNVGLIIVLALALVGGVGSFAWKNYAPKSYVDELVNYKPISISEFTASPSAVEAGSTVSSVTLSYKLSKEAASATLGAETVALSGKEGSIVLDGLSLTSNKTWRLSVTEPASAAAASAATAYKDVTLSFQWRRYWGAGGDVEVTDSFLNNTLPSRELAAGRGKTFTVTAAAGQYIWYAVPSSFGSCAFKVGGFDGGFTLVKTFTHTNASGGQTSYSVYRSDNPGLGSTTVTVS
jgi:hypothetical protein